MDTFTVEILTPRRAHPPHEVRSLDVPAAEGRLTVLPRHQPFICELAAGDVKVVNTDGERETWSIGQGTLWVKPDGVTLLTREATTACSPS